MWVLALDTTTREGSLAIVRDDDVVHVRPGGSGWSHAERVPADLRDGLAAVGLTLGDIDVFAVATGPGAFTGLRVGLAAVQGLALATGTPAVGVPALAAWSWAVMTERAVDVAGAWLDASRGEVFAAAYADVVGVSKARWPLAEVAPPSAASPLATLESWRGVVAPGVPVAALVPPDATRYLAEAGHVPVATGLLAGIVGRLAWREHRDGRSGPPAALAPVYVRRPDAEIERERRRAATSAP